MLTIFRFLLKGTTGQIRSAWEW